MHSHGDACPDEQGYIYPRTDFFPLPGDQVTPEYEYTVMGGRWNNDSIFPEKEDKKERYRPKSRAPVANKAVPKSAVQDKARAKSPDKARI